MPVKANGKGKTRSNIGLELQKKLRIYKSRLTRTNLDTASQRVSRDVLDHTQGERETTGLDGTYFRNVVMFAQILQLLIEICHPFLVSFGRCFGRLLE